MMTLFGVLILSYAKFLGLVLRLERGVCSSFPLPPFEGTVRSILAGVAFPLAAFLLSRFFWALVEVADQVVRR